MIKNNNLCNNCGKQGHLFYQCKLPITSYGIIAFRLGINGFEYLMIRRKNSFGYIDFIRGKYSPYNLAQLKNIVNEMSLEEKNEIQTSSFEKLWSNMWGDTNIKNNQYKNEESASKRKFELLKEGVIIDFCLYTLKDIVDMSETTWHETEWEFPKGRRNQREKDLDCALREFQEETGISQTYLTIIDNLLPIEEIFIGSNHKAYKHKYFLASFNNAQKKSTSNELNNFQVTEVSKLEWKSLDKCLESIRPYNLEKRTIIKNINNLLQEYRLYL